MVHEQEHSCRRMNRTTFLEKKAAAVLLQADAEPSVAREYMVRPLRYRIDRGGGEGFATEEEFHG